MSEVFDPEKIERPYVKEWGHHAVYPADYDKLLALYREAAKEKFVSTTGFDDLLRKLNP